MLEKVKYFLKSKLILCWEGGFILGDVFIFYFFSLYLLKFIYKLGIKFKKKGKKGKFDGELKIEIYVVFLNYIIFLVLISKDFWLYG